MSLLKMCGARGERQERQREGRGVEGERENESPAERREKNTESRRCRRDSSDPFYHACFLGWQACVRPCGRWVACQMCSALKGSKAFRVATLTY